jgi:hypothetical protein
MGPSDENGTTRDGAVAAMVIAAASSALGRNTSSGPWFSTMRALARV